MILACFLSDTNIITDLEINKIILLFQRLLLYRDVKLLLHRQQPVRPAVLLEALHQNVQRIRPRIRVEIKRHLRNRPNPLGYLPVIRDRGSHNH